MTTKELIQYRLTSQHLAGQHLTDPAKLVQRLGAMQAQDFRMSKWAIGVRIPVVTVGAIEAALNEGRIIRTHVLRPTWHLVAAEDLGWMIALTGPHLKRTLASYNRNLGLDEATVATSNKIISKALEGKNLTRSEIITVLERKGIHTDPMKASQIMFGIEVAGIACSGPTKGKEHTYALTEERVPSQAVLTKAEALFMLADRYFSGHGPASLKDFQWWSGLPAGEAREGLESVKSTLHAILVNTETLYFKEQQPASVIPELCMLPAFDEYLVGYKNRDAVLPQVFSRQTITANGIFKPVILNRGVVIGNWKAEQKKEEIVVHPSFFAPATARQEKLTRTVATSYIAFRST
ncbi:MAG: winged helix DNA-binding domain-containing protein [Sphingobacteriales bacterium]|nr:MAG: winged helix DNA-binding domain-containing protein [Sphingobacteriales bacterium]